MTSNFILTTLAFWVLWGIINLTLIIIELVRVMRHILRAIGWDNFKENILGQFIKRILSLLVTYIVLGPFSTVTSIQFSKAISLYKHFIGKEVMADLYGVGRTHQIDIGSSMSAEPKVWIKFHSYPDPILIPFSNLTFISNEEY